MAVITSFKIIMRKIKNTEIFFCISSVNLVSLATICQRKRLLWLTYCSCKSTRPGSPATFPSPAARPPLQSLLHHSQFCTRSFKCRYSVPSKFAFRGSMHESCCYDRYTSFCLMFPPFLHNTETRSEEHTSELQSR